MCLASCLLVLTLPAWSYDRESLVVPDLEALARSPKINLPPPPAWPAGHTESVIQTDDLRAEFGKFTNRIPDINSVRTRFIRPDYDWLVAYTSWFMRLNRALNLVYKDQAWDCDKFSRSFVAFADVLALRAGESRGSICVAWATVANKEAFGEVYGSEMGTHALVLVGTNRGIFVIEPQSGTMAPLKNYPNKDEFQEINL